MNNMDAELKEYLENMEARIMERVGGRIDAAEERLKAHTSAECEKVETKLLTEFHKWVGPPICAPGKPWKRTPL